MLGGRAPPLVPLRGRAAARPTVGLPPPAGPADCEHRPASRPAAPHRAPQPGAGSHAWPPLLRRRRRGGRGRTEARGPGGDDHARTAGASRTVPALTAPASARAAAAPPCPNCLGHGQEWQVSGPLVVTPPHAAHGPDGRVPRGWGDGCGSRGPGGTVQPSRPGAGPYGLPGQRGPAEHPRVHVAPPRTLAAALLRKSKLAPSAPTRRFRHRSIANDSGRPSSVIRLSTLHASTDSTACAARVRLRSRSPRIDLYRKNAFSTRACR